MESVNVQHGDLVRAVDIAAVADCLVQVVDQFSFQFHRSLQKSW